jgi:hypothetical protein
MAFHTESYYIFRMKEAVMGIANKDRATFSIDPAIRQRLEEYVPKSRRSAFVEQAIAEALRKEAIERLGRTLDHLAATAPKGGEDSLEVLRRYRRRMDGRPIELLDGD